MAGITDAELEQVLSEYSAKKPADNRQQTLDNLERQYGLPTGILNRVLKGESSGPKSRSPKGATGEFQLMPSIAQAYGVKDTSNFDASARAAAQMLGDANKTYAKENPNMNESDRTNVLLAHYNGGWANGRSVAAGKPPVSKETQAYVARVGINSVGTNTQKPTRNGISDAELEGILAEYSAKQQQPTETPTQAGARRRADAGEAIRVGVDSTLNTLTAGLYRKYTPEKNKLASAEEIGRHPVAETVGSVVGTAPYALVPGGLAVQSGVLAGRGALQAGVEGQNAAGVLTAGALEGAAPGVGKLVGKGLEYAGKGVRTAVNKLYATPPEYSKAITAYMSGSHGTRNARLIKSTEEKAIQEAKDSGKYVMSSNRVQKDAAGDAYLKSKKSILAEAFVENLFGNSLTPTAAIAGGVYGAMQNPDSPFSSAVTYGLGAGALKAALSKTLLQTLPQVGPSFVDKALKYLPTTERAGDLTKFKDFWLDQRFAQYRAAKLEPNLSAAAKKELLNKYAAEVKSIYEKEAEEVFEAAQRFTNAGYKATGTAATAGILTGAKTVEAEQRNRTQAGRQVSDAYLDRVLKGGRE